MADLYTVTVTIRDPEYSRHRVSVVPGTTVSDLLTLLYRDHVPGGFPDGYCICGWGDWVDKSIHENSFDPYLINELGQICLNPESVMELRVYTSGDIPIYPQDTLTQELLADGCELCIEDPHMIRVEGNIFYGCPVAKDVVGVVPEGMLTAAQEMKERVY